MFKNFNSAQLKLLGELKNQKSIMEGLDSFTEEIITVEDFSELFQFLLEANLVVDVKN